MGIWKRKQQGYHPNFVKLLLWDWTLRCWFQFLQQLNYYHAFNFESQHFLISYGISIWFDYKNYLDVFNKTIFVFTRLTRFSLVTFVSNRIPGSKWRSFGYQKSLGRTDLIGIFCSDKSSAYIIYRIWIYKLFKWKYISYIILYDSFSCRILQCTTYNMLHIGWPQYKKLNLRTSHLYNDSYHNHRWNS